jgi:DASS family divalent anion:Na+ symporter
MLVIFLSTVLGIILRPLPMGAMAFLGLVAICLSGTLGLQEALQAFSVPSVWLIVMAFFIAKGFVITGLGRRIALYFLAAVGKSPIGLGYGVLLSDLVLAPAIPSSTARCGGVLLPIVQGISATLDSHPHSPSAGRLGRYLNLLAFHGTVFSSTMFVTAMAANPLAAQICLEAGIEISWGLWAAAGLLPGALCVLMLPPLLRFLAPPEVQDTRAASDSAKAELQAMGALSMQEAVMLGTFILMVSLWIAGPYLGLPAALTAMLGLALLLLSRIVTWDTVRKEAAAWDTLMWFAVLVMMASQLKHLGVMDFLGGLAAGPLTGYPWPLALSGLGLVYFYIHYLFASNTAHVSALMAPFLAIALGTGAPPVLAALSFCYLSALCGGLTHYGCGHAPILFGAGYCDLKTWWRVGFYVATTALVVWALVGPIWWSLLGLL